MDVRGTVVRRGGIITGGLVVEDISMGFNIEMIRWLCVSMRARIRVSCAGDLRVHKLHICNGHKDSAYQRA